MRNRHLSSANWLRYEDTCSKAFFDFHRIGKKKTLLRELETKSETIMGQNDLTHYITDYYTHFYTSDAFAPGTTEAQEHYWHSVLTKVMGDMNSDLIKNLTLPEIFGAICALPKHDGVPMEFFHECAQEVGQDLLQAFTAMLSEGATSIFINKGLITLIPNRATMQGSAIGD